MNEKIKNINMFDFSKTIASELFEKFEYPHEILPHIGKFILEICENLNGDFTKIEENIWVHKTAKIAKSAEIIPPAIICANAEIRHCAYLRGNVIVGENAVVGNSTELKNAILFDSVQVPHYNYVGDSILGYKAHMGAGSITSNVKSDMTNITIRDGENSILTNMQKVGAFLGDCVEIGCNAVLNPGTAFCKNSTVAPLSSVRGVVPENSIHKRSGEIVEKR